MYPAIIKYNHNIIDLALPKEYCENFYDKYIYTVYLSKSLSTYSAYKSIKNYKSIKLYYENNNDKG